MTAKKLSPQNPPIHFEKVQSHHKEVVLSWLEEPHMKEFWDNSQEHKDDIVNFINGRKEPSSYFGGIFTYWIGSIEGTSYSFILTAEVHPNEETLELWKDHLSQVGKTVSIDFGIGNKDFLGKGLAAPTLVAFTKFFKDNVDPKVDTLFIDPQDNNPRAYHVYEKAGFKVVGNYERDKHYWDFNGKRTYLMVKKI